MSSRCLWLCHGHNRPTQCGTCVRGSVLPHVSKILLKQFGDGGVEGPIILKPTLRVSYEDTDFIHLVQIRNQRMGLTTMITNRLVSLDDWKFFFNNWATISFKMGSDA